MWTESIESRGTVNGSEDPVSSRRRNSGLATSDSQRERRDSNAGLWRDSVGF